MKSKVIVGMILTLLPMSLLILTSNFQSVKAGSTVVSLNPVDSTVQLGDSFTIDVNLTDVTDWGAWEFKLGYDTAILDATYVSPTPDTIDNTDWVPIDALGRWWPDRPPTIDDTIGRVWCGALVPVPLGGGRNGNFRLVTINFTATGKGSCTLDLYDTNLGNSYGDPIVHTAIDGSVTVKVISEDNIPPTWSNAGTNNTVGGQPTRFHVKWTDNAELSGFIFGTNNTGTWRNDTWTPMGGTTNWSNVTKILSSTASLVQWRVWANDTSNNWNDTGILSLSLLQPPHAEFTYSPSTPYIDETVTFDATSSYDPDGYIVSYAWDFGDDTTGTGNATTHSYADDGVYTVTLNVTDDDGLSSTTSAKVTVLNKPPIASFTENATTVLTGEAISFNASASYDPDGTIVKYFWDFGDDTNAIGVTTSHSYADNGTYTVTLTVTDDDDATDTASSTKNVLNRPPVADANGPYVGYEGSPITFDASGSTDVDGTIVLYEWDWDNDGSYDESTTSRFFNHIWPDDFSGTVGLRVTDDDGLTDTATASVTVYNVAPTVNAGADQTVYVGQTVNFTGSFTDPGTNDTHTIFWNFGDGTNTTDTLTPTHVYTEVKVYTVTLKVTDDNEGVGTDTLTITVLPVPVHDIAIIDVVPPSILEVDVGDPVDIKVIVKNEGNVEESFTVNLYAGVNLIGTRTETLAAGSNETYTFTWNTAGVALGEYTIRAEVPSVTGEIDTADNVKTTTWGIDIIPEFPSWIAWVSVIAITSLAVFFGSRKLQRRKHTRAAARELTEN